MNGQPEPKWTDGGATFEMNGIVARETRVATLIFRRGCMALHFVPTRCLGNIEIDVLLNLIQNTTESHIPIHVLGEEAFCSPLSMSAGF